MRHLVLSEGTVVWELFQTIFYVTLIDAVRALVPFAVLTFILAVLRVLVHHIKLLSARRNEIVNLPIDWSKRVHIYDFTRL